MKATIHGFIAECGGQFHFFSSEMQEYGYSTVMPYSIDVDIPADYDATAARVRLLEAQKQKARADFQRTVTEIDRQIQSLLAIEHVEQTP
jgi:hypothetical protein